MKEKEFDAAAREIAKIVTGCMPYLNETRISHNLYDYFSGDHLMTTTEFDEVQFYFVEDLKDILETAFDERIYEDEDSLVTSSDIRWAFSHLSDTYQYRILERFKHGVARSYDSPERAQLNRALAKMCDILNGWNRQTNYDGPGSRDVWSNARSAYEIDSQYSGDGSSGGGRRPFDPYRKN